jgi:hypothetical protein
VCLSVSLSDVTTYDDDDDDDDDSNSCITLHVRIANQVVMGSCCRGGIVHIRCVCTSSLVERPDSPKALWRFRVSTSNSPSGRTWLHPYTQIHRIDQIYAQQDIRVCEDDHFEPPNWQFANPKAL